MVRMELVKEHPGLAQGSALFAYSRRHCAHSLPALRLLRRIDIAWQAATPWRLNNRVWQDSLGQAPCGQRSHSEAPIGTGTLVRQICFRSPLACVSTSAGTG